jgi:hypothetical protein
MEFIGYMSNCQLLKKSYSKCKGQRSRPPPGPKGVPGRLRPRIFLTFGNTRVVGCQPHAPAAFTPEEFPGTHFYRLSPPQGTWFRRQLRKKSPVWHHPQCLNHYATSGPSSKCSHLNISLWLYYEDIEQQNCEASKRLNNNEGKPLMSTQIFSSHMWGKEAS